MINIKNTIFEKLNKTFITPIDREDIHELAHELDSVIDYILKVSNHMKVYKVTDIWDNNGYIYVVNNNVSGTMNTISPNRLSPKTIKLNNSNVQYEFSKYVDYNLVVNNTSFYAGYYATLILGKDNKIVGIVYWNYWLFAKMCYSLKEGNFIEFERMYKKFY